MINSQYSTFPQGSLFIFNYGLEDTKNSLSVWSVQKQLYFSTCIAEYSVGKKSVWCFFLNETFALQPMQWEPWS